MVWLPRKATSQEFKSPDVYLLSMDGSGSNRRSRSSNIGAVNVLIRKLLSYLVTYINNNYEFMGYKLNYK